jgi:hypothetical protein
MNDMDILKPVTPQAHHNYVAFFLSLTCNLSCPWCINLHADAERSEQGSRRRMGADDWITAANRLKLRSDLPLTLQGGEPTLYKGFYRLVNEVRPEIKMDLMTNLMFDVEEFIENVPVSRFTREAPYASIRVSYHPGQNSIDELIRKTMRLQEAGFRIGIYGIDHPCQELNQHVKQTRDNCLKLGLDFRMKEFLGQYDGKTYGTFKYHDSVCADMLRHCQCRTTEFIVDPAGYVFRCHSDLYKRRAPVAHILDPQFSEDEIDSFRDCQWYGDCNPCDVKVKTNRFQVFGHTSVEIINII